MNTDAANIETQKLRLEELKFQHTVATDERRLTSERLTKLWSPLLTLVPILAIIVGYYFNSQLEKDKSTRTHTAEVLSLKRQFIDRQLADFYYPIQMRLEKDTAVWTLAYQLTKRSANSAFSKHIENNVLLPNHEEVIGIIGANFSLLKNGDENYDPANLIKTINHYQRHVAAFKTLRKLGIYDLNPIQVCNNCDYPRDFSKLMSARIIDLEKQRAALTKEVQQL